MKNNKIKDLIGCCGLFCGLCNKYQSTAPSRCIGCKLGEQHSWCSIWKCCVKKNGFETCAECGSIFRCPIFVRRGVADWIPAAGNLHRIRESDLEAFSKAQAQRQALLEDLLQMYNDGRSMSLFCKICARMPMDLIKKAMAETKDKISHQEAHHSERQVKAKIFKSVIKEIALSAHIDLS